MARIAKNILNIRPLEGTDFFFLSGQIDGKQIRLKNRDITILEEKKSELERAAEQNALRLASAPNELSTYLTKDQLRDAEAAFRALQRSHHNSTLLEAVTAGIAHLATGGNVNAIAALNEWQDYQRDVEKLFAPTLESNFNIVDAFLKMSKVVTLGEISPKAIDSYVMSGKVSAGTQLTRASRLNAWLNFCVKKKHLRTSPMELDLSQMADRAERDRERSRIITPEQCEALLQAAIDECGGAMVPYVILSTWCFMRNAEAQRTMQENIRFGSKNMVDVFPRKSGTVSYRRITIPENMVALLKDCIASGVWKKGKPVFWSRNYWDIVREKAGLIVRGPERPDGGHRTIIGGIWQENILRHTGISYHYQKYGNIVETTRQAGNSEDTAFKHYVSLAEDGDGDKFYAIRGELKKEVAQEPAQFVA